MATPRICSAEGCSNRHYGHGYCLAHYKRWRKYGTPMGGSTAAGAAQRFVADAVSSNTDDCIIYPFYRNQSGYGWMRNPKGGNIGAHVLVAILRHGDKPTEKHEACHRCGNGHLGCVNPNHIYWGTRSDNMKDAFAHGPGRWFKHESGEQASAAKFSDDFIQRVREALSRGEKQTDIAARLGISQSHVSRIKNGTRAA